MTEVAGSKREDLSIDQQLALRTAAARLGEQFAGIYGPETIERFLHSSYDQFATGSTVPNFLPLLAERFARQRLTALARVEGHQDDGRPVVLFLCVHNAGRSQMALGFFEHLVGDRAIGWSGGSEPGIEVNEAAVASMAERGIDISIEYPKPWTDEAAGGCCGPAPQAVTISAPAGRGLATGISGGLLTVVESEPTTQSGCCN